MCHSNSNGGDRDGCEGSTKATLRGAQTAVLYRTMGNTFQRPPVPRGRGGFVRLAVHMATDQDHRMRVRRRWKRARTDCIREQAAVHCVFVSRRAVGTGRDAMGASAGRTMV